MKPKHFILSLLALTISATAFADIPEGNITFEDPAVKAFCVANWDTNSDGELSYAEAAAVTTIGSFFYNKITSFNEFQYFTGVTSIENYAFYGCSSLVSIHFASTTPKVTYAWVDTPTLFVPDVAVDSYKATWTNYVNQIVPESKSEYVYDVTVTANESSFRHQSVDIY